VVAFVAARSNFGVAQRHAFDLTREIVKTIVHRREVVAERILVVAVRFAIWSGSLPHAIPSLADAKTQETAGPLEPAPTHENWRLARSEVRAQTFLHYGKQAVNPLAGHADFLQLRPSGRPRRPVQWPGHRGLQSKLVRSTGCTPAPEATLRCFGMAPVA